MLHGYRGGMFLAVLLIAGLTAFFIANAKTVVMERAVGRIMPIGARKIPAVAPFDETIWSNPLPSLRKGISHHVYRSEVMNVDVGYNIYLPSEYHANAARRFPVIYALHGLAGDENSNLDAHVTSQPAIVVYVNGGRNSKYRDAAPASRMDRIVMVETSIVSELIPHIDAIYRTIDSREGRSIQGISMGGMGALRLALKYPQIFGSVYSIAGAIDDNASNVLSNEPELMAAMFNNNPQLFDAGTPQAIAANNAPNIRASGIAIRLSVGSADALLTDNRAFAQLLTSLNINHEPLDVVAGAGHSAVSSVDTIAWAMSQFVAKSAIGRQ